MDFYQQLEQTTMERELCRASIDENEHQSRMELHVDCSMDLEQIENRGMALSSVELAAYIKGTQDASTCTDIRSELRGNALYRLGRYDAVKAHRLMEVAA